MIVGYDPAPLKAALQRSLAEMAKAGVSVAEFGKTMKNSINEFNEQMKVLNENLNLIKENSKVYPKSNVNPYTRDYSSRKKHNK